MNQFCALFRVVEIFNLFAFYISETYNYNNNNYTVLQITS